MTASKTSPSSIDALRLPEVRAFIGAIGSFTFASRALAVVIGFQIYQITHSALSLGWLGLIEAVPALSLVLFGGYIADHYDRRKILLFTRSASFLCALGLAALSFYAAKGSLIGLYSVIFLVGIARGFADPANAAFESQVVPRHLTINGSSWISSMWISASIIGPGAIGFVFEAWGAIGAYLLIAAFFFLSVVATITIAPKPLPLIERKEPLFKSIALGWTFVFSHQPLWGAMALDLFAVLFGGAIALLPIYATDILHVGARGLGLLNAATSIGALITTLIATRHPPIGRAGRNLFISVLGFGVSILIFAFSKNFWLSMSALFLSGAFDGISMVIRRSMTRLLTPNELRGRVSSVGFLFICSSNELGAFESGMVAAWIGTVPCVAAGGIITFLVVAITALLTPELRRLRFDTTTMAQTKTS
ncbi:MAG: MFS transporter [Candidatus Omnitrophica bacterium]|nr:MFS transporter [Candidatus Omnitrophota bacterium]